MPSKTFRLFLISGAILLGTILTSMFWDNLQLGESKIPLAGTTTIAFGISIAGLILGFEELKKIRTLKLWVGIVGHFIVVGVFVITVIYAMSL